MSTSPVPKQALVFRCLQYKYFENTAGKGEIACNVTDIGPAMFSAQEVPEFMSVSTNLEKFLPFSSNLKLSSANSFNLEECKICCLGMD